MDYLRMFGLVVIILGFLLTPFRRADAQESQKVLVPELPEQLADTGASVVPLSSLIDSMRQAFSVALSQLILPDKPLASGEVEQVRQQLHEMGEFVVRYIAWELSVPGQVMVSPVPASVLIDRFREFERWAQQHGCIATARIEELPMSRQGAAILKTLEPPVLHLKVQFRMINESTESHRLSITIDIASIQKLMQ